MEDGLVLLIGLGIVVYLGIRSRRKEDRRNEEFNSNRTALVNRYREEILSGDGNTNVPKLDAGSVGYRPVGKETLLAVQAGVSRLEWKNDGNYRTRGTSVSIPIVKGVRYRVGGGSFQSKKTLQETARGRLLITDKAVVFEGDRKSERITWTQISDAETLTDGFEIFKRSGPPRLFQTQDPNPQFAAVLEVMLEAS